MAQVIYTIEELRELWQELHDLADDDYAKLHPLALTAECLDHELQGNVLQGPIDNLVLDYRSIEFGYLLKILKGVLMQEAILIEEAVKHASVNLLLFLLLRVAEFLHDFYQLSYLLIDEMGLSREYSLEVFIGSVIDFFRVPCGSE